MSQDKMLDAFPILFGFKQGELPDEEKLSGLIKHVDIAFDDVTEVIGDPWDVQQHSWNSSVHKLSLERLSQASLARIIGPSDWIGPMGGDFSSSSSITVDLKPYKNSWILGYPLVSQNATVTQKSESSRLDPLVWGTNIIVTRDVDNCLTTRKTYIKNVTQDGDFYVDFYKGIIVSYKPTTSYIRLTISNLNSLAAGVPWGTHNVIPAWEESSDLCTLTLLSSDSDSSTYTLTLPEVGEIPRAGYIGKQIAGGSYTDWAPDTQWYYNPGQTSRYKLPPSITGSMSAGNEIPEGFILIWDDSLGRVLPGINSIRYASATSLTIEAPLGYLEEGTNYRVITTGTSLSEAVSYLLVSQRYDSHTGITNSAKLGYSVPISHDDLENRYTDKSIVATSEYSVIPFQFRESDYPTNCHPQYLHRYGYMEEDIDGNTGNAMRGDILFSGELDDGEYAIGSDKTTSGNYTKTYGIRFGNSSSGVTAGTRIRFGGGQGLDTWAGAGNPPVRFGFGLQETGAIPSSSRGNETYGALAITPWYGTPLYIRGLYNTPSGAASYVGGVLGFDLGRNSEFNYIKLMTGYRTGNYDVPHLPAIADQSVTTGNPISPLINVFSAEQIREFRFRGVSYNPDSLNIVSSLGGAGTRADDSAIPEFYSHYTSPGIVGADFINVYSNAIFFSEAGDGTTTNFTIHGKTWLDNIETDPWTSFYAQGQFNSYMPTGIYFHPAGTDIGQRYVFSLRDSTVNYTQPLNFGDRSGFEYVSNLGGNVRLSTRQETGAAINSGGGIILAAGSNSKSTIDGFLSLNHSAYERTITLYADRSIDINSSIAAITTTSTLEITGRPLLLKSDNPYVYLFFDEEELGDTVTAGTVKRSSTGYLYIETNPLT